MKITIDTKEDSKEEIRKAIQFLSSLTDGAVYTNKPTHQQDVFSDSSPSMGNVFGNLFGSEEKPPEAPPPPVPPNAAGLPPSPKPEAPDVKEEEEDKKPEMQIIDY